MDLDCSNHKSHAISTSATIESKSNISYFKLGILELIFFKKISLLSAMSDLDSTVTDVLNAWIYDGVPNL
jgi:hypothetical protein